MRRIRSLFVTVSLIAAAVVSLNALASHMPDDRCVADSYLKRSLSGAVPADLPVGSELIMRFVNVSDTHIIDDEATTAMTGSWLESLLEPAIGNGSAQRLQEEYTDEVLNALETTINACDS
ncbi:MAG TPA: hypothetical protein VNA87_07070, partial [Actinomycetota bacterium]|nr:hypothetical protein [Actinomycetota bacterium]